MRGFKPVFQKNRAFDCEKTDMPYTRIGKCPLLIARTKIVHTYDNPCSVDRVRLGEKSCLHGTEKGPDERVPDMAATGVAENADLAYQTNSLATT